MKDLSNGSIADACLIRGALVQEKDFISLSRE
jgi:hypothetical protein